MAWDPNVLETKIISFRIKSDQSSIFLSAFYVVIFLCRYNTILPEMATYAADHRRYRLQRALKLPRFWTPLKAINFKYLVANATLQSVFYIQ